MTEKQYEGISIYRPIQYLGSKVRSIPEIIEAVNKTVGYTGTCLDLFAGSSVVSQALKNSGWKVVSNDALTFSYYTNSAFIEDHESQPLESLLHISERQTPVSDSYKREIEIESLALSNEDYDTLIKQNLEKVAGWENFQPTEIAENTKANQDVAKILYSGTYFGFTQSAAIDSLRNSIKSAKSANKISGYEQSLMMTALFSAMSKSVFSAGKHFAQPHLIKPEKNKLFISKRILQDRGVDIYSEFKQQLKKLFEVKSTDKPSGSIATNFSMEDIISSPDRIGNIDVIYADPPYTAQQYSRFYHIPEVISGDEFPELQIVKGRVTKGLYPKERFKSRFCSKTYAPHAFRDLCILAKEKESSLILSYSLSKHQTTGNDRMIGFDSLKSILKEYFGDNIDYFEFEHTYRQFNKSESIVESKDDKEIQIVCRNN